MAHRIVDAKLRAMTTSAAGAIEKLGVNVRQKVALNRSMLDVAPGQFWCLLVLVAPALHLPDLRCAR
jgi:hypothetical protein